MVDVCTRANEEEKREEERLEVEESRLWKLLISRCFRLGEGGGGYFSRTILAKGL